MIKLLYIPSGELIKFTQGSNSLALSTTGLQIIMNNHFGVSFGKIQLIMLSNIFVKPIPKLIQKLAMEYLLILN